MLEKSLSWPALAAVVAMTLLTLGAGLMVSQAVAKSFSLVLYLIVSSAAILDLFDLAVRLYFRRAHGVPDDSREYANVSAPLAAGTFTPRQQRAHLRPYAIIASVHNAEPWLDDFLITMARYRDRFWIIDDASSDQTCIRLTQAGWRCIRAERNLKKPGAIKALLATLPAEIDTVMVIDPDITIRDGTVNATAVGSVSLLERAIFDFQRSGMAAACPRIAIKEDGLLARFQALEYCMSCSLGRSSLGDRSLNSGVSLYRRAALKMVLDRHSLSVYAEDLENSLILLDAGERIYYDGRLVIETEGMRSWHRWFSQRVGWFYGLVKVFAERFDSIKRISKESPRSGYQFMVYTALFGIALHPVKVVAMVLLLLGISKSIDGLFGFNLLPDWAVADPAYFLGAYTKYTILAIIALLVAVPRRERLHLVPAIPLCFFYFMAHIAPVTVGYLNWISLWLHGRRVYADHYQEEATIMRKNGNGLAASGGQG